MVAAPCLCSLPLASYFEAKGRAAAEGEGGLFEKSTGLRGGIRSTGREALGRSRTGWSRPREIMAFDGHILVFALPVLDLAVISATFRLLTDLGRVRMQRFSSSQRRRETE